MPLLAQTSIQEGPLHLQCLTGRFDESLLEGFLEDVSMRGHFLLHTWVREIKTPSLVLCEPCMGMPLASKKLAKHNLIVPSLCLGSIPYFGCPSFVGKGWA